MKPTVPLYFVHISDTHIGHERELKVHNQLPFFQAEQIVNVVNNMAVLPDFVIHTGDVVNDPSPEAYQLASEVFTKLKVPIYYVTGNHDNAVDIHQYLPMGTKEDLTTNRNFLFYRFEEKGYEFLVLDGKGANDIDPQGLLPKNQLTYLNKVVNEGEKPLIIFIHFPALPMNSYWFDNNMLLQNGILFHEAIRDSQRLRGVFHGHIHQSMQTIQDRVLYVSGASTFAQFMALPEDSEIHFDSDYNPGYGLVHVLPEKLIIHQHTFSQIL
jgi:DNA repair exonuclease SbcCD nuclease subunit